jgi:glycerol-3-phosphate dehydrogenase (NAD(P)+)
MAQAVILGAGYMGSALSFPLADNGLRVHLWGTWLDDEVIDASKKGVHPKLKCPLPETVRLFHSEELEESVEGADFCVVAVSTDGFIPVFQRLVGVLPKPCPLFTVTKGFVQQEGNVERVSEAAHTLYEKRFSGLQLHWSSIGGPVKAVELSQRVPTATIFAHNSFAIGKLIRLFPTAYYRVDTTGDIAGVELCSAFKNIYSIACGIHDGLYSDIPDRLFHNFKSLLFNQSVREMALIVGAAGGKPETVFDLAGVGDLHVTSSSGRNRRFGECIGRGVGAREAHELMNREGEIAEGYHTLELGLSYLKRYRKDIPGDLPLFNMLHRIVIQGCVLEEEIERFLTTYMDR